MAVKIAINGFGRIGRPVFKTLLENDDAEIVAVNDLFDTEKLAHLLKYDSAYGVYDKEVSAEADGIVVDGRKIPFLAERNPEELPWDDMDVDVALECTGIFRTKELASQHLTAGADRVIISAPAKDEIDRSVVIGVNDDEIQESDKVLSNASCTTNCLAPVAKVLNDEFGIENGILTTVHSYTANQHIHDAPHPKDPRRARAAAENIIPTTTGAAIAVTRVIPELKGKLDGMAMRVPTLTGSVVDFVATLSTDIEKKDMDAAMKKAAEGPMKDILVYTEEPYVLKDIVGNPASSIYDSGASMMVGGNMVKVISWYDNEWGYANRIAELGVMLGKKF